MTAVLEVQGIDLSDERLIHPSVALDPNSIFVDSTTIPYTTISITGTIPAWLDNNDISNRNLFLSKLYLEFNDILDCEILHPMYQDTVREIISRVIEIYDEIHNS